MANLADLLVHVGVDSDVESGMDDASSAVEDFEGTTGKVASFVEDNFAKMGAAAAGIGAGLEGFARSQQDNNYAFERLGRVTGEGSDAMRDMAGSLQDVTFPMEDVTALMETATKRGLEGDAIADYANFWDMVGDATGEAGPALGEAGVALGLVGIKAGEEAEALDAFGYITDNTTGSVEDFLRFIEKTGSELGDNTPHINDMAGALEALEENGYKADRAQRELRTALSESDGDMVAALETLGVSESEYRTYADAVEGSGEAIGANADAYKGLFTPMEELSAKAENLMTKYGGLADAAGMVSGPMAGVGSAMMGVSMLAPNLVSSIGGVVGSMVSWATTTAAQGAKAVASMAVTAGQFVAHYTRMAAASLAQAARMAASWVIAMGPVAWVIAGVVALVALIIANWDTIVEWTKKAWDTVVGWVTDAWNWITETTTAGVEAVVGFFTDLREKVIGIVVGWVTKVLAKALEMRRKMIEFVTGLRDRVVEFFGNIRDRAVEAATQLATKAIAKFLELKNGAIDRARELLEYVRGLPGDIVSAIGNLGSLLLDKGKDVVRGLWDGIKSMGGWIADKISGWASDMIPGPIAKALGISSPSTVAADLAREVPRGMMVGMDGEASKLARSAEGLAMAALPNLGVPSVHGPSLPRVGGVDAGRPMVLRLDAQQFSRAVMAGGVEDIRLVSS